MKVVAAFSNRVRRATLFINIFGRAGLVKHESISLTPDNNHQFWFPINVTKEMTPSCRVVCYYIQQSGEIIYDQLVFKVVPTSSHTVSVFNCLEMFFFLGSVSTKMAKVTKWRAKYQISRIFHHFVAFSFSVFPLSGFRHWDTESVFVTFQSKSLQRNIFR